MAPTKFPDDSPRFSRRLALALAAITGGAIGASRLVEVESQADTDTNTPDTPQTPDTHGSHDTNDTHETHDTNDDTDKVPALGTVPAGSVEVRIIDDDSDGFRPRDIKAAVGQTVTFVNLDDDPHSATGAEFDTGIMQPGEQATVTFDEAGVFPFACQIHPEMTGTVEVGGPATPVASPAGGGATFEVRIADFSFDPQEITVPAGSVVTWVNTGAITHTATASDRSFDTGVIEPGGEATHRFEQAGEVAYICAFHPNMTGTVIVT